VGNPVYHHAMDIPYASWTRHANRATWALAVAGTLVLAACVTINVYFPAAAAEKAADRIIDEVWGEGDGSGSRDDRERRGSAEDLLRGLLRAALDAVIPTAAAQANLDISTPAVNALRDAMAARHRQLARHYDSGAVGLTDEGLVAVRDPRAVPLAQRPGVSQLVAAENRDRNALYRAIAEANGHPEWEPDIRATFARRWIERARQGWWYETGGSWKQR
jgi:uncharacterized protein YdbL (DUF1318 family)